MSLVENIENKLQSQNTSNYDIKEIDFLPSQHNMSGRNAYKVDVCVLYIELRGSNNLDISNWQSSIPLIHRLAIDPIYQILAEFEGTILPTPSNGVLALWNTSKSNINKAVEAALTINWLLKVKYETLDKYPSFDFGLALHHGPALAIKTQVPGGDFDEEEIKYISPVINIAQSMSNQLSKPNTIGISHDVYERLYDETVNIKKSFVLIPYQKNIWDDDKIKFNEFTFKIKTSAHHMDYEDKSIEKL